MKEDTAIPVCMIGGGLNSAIGRTHEIAMHMDHRFQLVAGCFSRNKQINHDTAKAYGLANNMLFSSPEEMLEKVADNVHCAVVTTPIDQHAQHINLALDHKKTVITDKPLLANSEQCKNLSKRINVTGTEVFCLFNYTGYPAVRELRKRVLNGELGQIFRIMVEMPQDSYQRLMNLKTPKAVQQWRLHDGEIACVTLDLFVHIDSLIQFITAKQAVSVFARANSVSGISNGLIDDVDALISYEDNLLVNAWYSKVALGHRNGLSIRIYGEKGSAFWIQEQPETIEMTHQNGDRHIIDRISSTNSETTLARYNRFKAGHPAGFIEAFANAYYDIADAIEQDKPNSFTLTTEQAIDGLNLCQAIGESSSKRTTVYLHEFEIALDE